MANDTEERTSNSAGMNGAGTASPSAKPAPRMISWRYETAILLILLLSRLSEVALAWLIFGSAVHIPPWYFNLLGMLYYVLAAWLIWLKRNELGNLNIDKPFLYVYIFSGMFLFIFNGQGTFGLMTLLVSALLLGALGRGQFKFGDSQPNYLRPWYLVLVGLLPVVPALQRTLTSGDMQSFGVQSFFYLVLSVGLTPIVVEEALFRAALWGYLRHRRWHEMQILIIQAVLFWLIHWHMLVSSTPYSFWLATPFISLVLGVIVLRSRSVTLSTLTHFLYNLLVDLTHIG